MSLCHISNLLRGHWELISVSSPNHPLTAALVTQLNKCGDETWVARGLPRWRSDSDPSVVSFSSKSPYHTRHIWWKRAQPKRENTIFTCWLYCPILLHQEGTPPRTVSKCFILTSVIMKIGRSNKLDAPTFCVQLASPSST